VGVGYIVPAAQLEQHCPAKPGLKVDFLGPKKKRFTMAARHGTPAKVQKKILFFSTSWILLPGVFNAPIS